MGKGSLFMGMGRGKVGEIVFSRQDGEQVFRARNRHPHNPQTNKQLVQRAIMATIMSAYSAGREIFDHSFQGYSVGAGCQRRFMSLNANALRSQLAADFENATPEQALAKVTAPKIQTPIPNQYIVAEGTLEQKLFTEAEVYGEPSWQLPAVVANETIAQYAARNGMNAGDIYTFVFFTTSQAAADVLYKALGVASVEYDTVYRGAFGWLRLIVKNLASNTTVITSSTKYTDLFDLEAGGVGQADASFWGTIQIDAQIAPSDMVTVGPISAVGYAIGLIRSRRDADLRSNCTLQVVNPDEFGLYWNDILTAWQAGTTQIGSSDLILEGGDE